MPLIDFSHKPTGWLRRMLKAPTYIYRARLGILFGYRFVMIEHSGRNTGIRHFTVVEVARHLPREWVCIQEPDPVPTGIAISKQAASRRCGSGGDGTGRPSDSSTRWRRRASWGPTKEPIQDDGEVVLHDGCVLRRDG